MSKNLQKILVASASLLMLSSIGAAAGQAISPVHASRLSRLYAQRNRDSASLKKINSEIARLKHQSPAKHRKGHHSIHHHHARKHESIGTWYYHNGNHLKYKYLNKSLGFDHGYNDGKAAPFQDAMMNPKYVNEKHYKQGWVVSYYQSADEPESRHEAIKDYSNAANYANGGIDYLHNGEPRSSDGYIYLDSGQWANNTQWGH